MWFNMTEEGWLSRRQFVRNSTQPRQLLFISRNLIPPRQVSETYFSFFTCTATETYVEASIKCSGSTCGCDSIRYSLKDHLPSHISRWDGAGITVNYYQTLLFSSATDSEGSAASFYTSVTERYIENPLTPHLDDVDIGPPHLTNVSAETFSLRLTTAYNTYFKGYKAQPSVLAATSVNLAALNPPPDVTKIYGTGGSLKPNQDYLYGMLNYPRNTAAPYLARQSDAVWTEKKPTYVIHWPWAFVYFFSVGCLAVTVLMGIGFQLRRVAPEILLTVGSTLRDSRYINDADGRVRSGTWMYGVDTAKRVWNLRVAIRDVKAGESVGRVALVGGEDEVGWGDLDPNKMYE